MIHCIHPCHLALVLATGLTVACTGLSGVIDANGNGGAAGQPPGTDPPMTPPSGWPYPLTVSPDGKELLDGNGIPVFINAESAWHLNMRLTPTEVDIYLDSRATKGFNTALVTALVGIDYHGTHENYAGENPFTTMSPVSFASPNETYWQHVDWVVERARQKGFLVLLAPSYLGYQCGGQGFCSAMKAAGTSVMTQYGEWIGTRYASQENILWVHGGDADANAHGAMAEVNALANAIKNVDADHLHTAHCNRQNGARECYDRPWLDVDNTYSECVNVARETRDTYQRTPAKPHFFIEGWYENEHGTSDQCLRAQAYYNVLGGSIGHVYGIGEVWGFFSGWQSVLDTAGSDSMTHMRNLFESRDWSTLVPDFDHAVLTSGFGNIDNASYVASALTTDGNTFVAYLPSQTTITIDLGALSGATKNAYWYGPSDANSQTAGSYTGGSQTFTPPAAGDWVLVIDDAGAGYPPPGRCTDCPISCSDGVQNGDETGVDCGGSCPAACPTGLAYPLTVSPDGREVLDANGNPIYLNIESAWHIGTRLIQSEVDTYLDDRASKGFNAFKMRGMMGPDYHGTTANIYGDQPFLSMNPADFTQPNEAYWANHDWVIERARQKGFLVILAPAYLGYNCGGQGYCQDMMAAGPTVMQQYGEWIGNRYKDQENIIWLNGGDANANVYGALDEVNAVANGIKNVDPNHLHSAHCNRQNGARECYDQPWLDIDNTYSECTNVAREGRDTRNRTPVMPHFFVEGWYENEHSVSQQCLRAQAYYSILGESFGHVYGILPIYRFNTGWEPYLDTEGSDSMIHARNLFGSWNWGELQADYSHAVMTSGFGNLNDASYAGAALTSGGDTFIAYLPNQRTVTVNLDQLSGTTKNAHWYNPINGQSQSAGTHGAGSKSFTSPTASDWVLVIADVAAGQPVPAVAN